MSQELLENELLILRQAVDGLAYDAGFSFCHGCYNWGKSDQYNVIKCPCCQNWSCDNCDGGSLLHHDDTYLVVCGPCYDKYKSSKFSLLNIYRNNSLLRWFQISCLTDDLDTFIDNIIDTVNDFFSGGEYEDYCIDLIGIGKGPLEEFVIGVCFNSEGPDEATQQELHDELMSCLSEMDISDGIDLK